MAEFKNWIINICTAVFFITAVEMILPDNSMKKYAKFVLGLILITVLINPLVVLLNDGNTVNSFLNKSIEVIARTESSVEAANYREKSMEATLRAFKTNVEKVCREKLKEKYGNGQYDVNAEVTYDEEKEEFQIKSLEVSVNSGKVEKIRKVQIKPSSTIGDDTRVESEMSDEIKEFLSSELEMPKKLIAVYKMRT
jgi:stage III sporulation protein AF